MPISELKSITIFGGASGKAVKVIPVGPEHVPKYLMDFLRGAGVPIASSCLGEGFCQRCMVCEDVLSCQVSVADFLSQFPDGVCRVSYL